MICQQTTRAVIRVFTQEGYSADVYLDDFYGAEIPSVAHVAFDRLQGSVVIFLFPVYIVVVVFIFPVHVLDT